MVHNTRMVSVSAAFGFEPSVVVVTSVDSSKVNLHCAFMKRGVYGNAYDMSTYVNQYHEPTWNGLNIGDYSSYVNSNGFSLVVGNQGYGSDYQVKWIAYE